MTPLWLGVLAVVLAAIPQATTHSTGRRGEPAPPAEPSTDAPEVVAETETYLRNFTMPGITPKEDEAYLCVAQHLNASQEEWVVRFDPLASANRAHHMLLFGCSDVRQEYADGKVWDCGHHSVCEGSRIMYAWAKNAPTTSLPASVGFRISGQSGIRFLTLQIHYGKALPEGVHDHSGLQMEMTHEEQKYKAGIYLLAAGNVVIPGHTAKTHADMNCLLSDSGEPQDIHLFAYRVHAHALGTVISGYLFDTTRNEYTEVAKGNPHWPQAFYPMNETHIAKTSDILHARCTWDSTNRERVTLIGSTAKDEMCNLYIMYYTDREKGSEFGLCGMETYPIITKNLPPDSDVPLPPNPTLEEHAQGENKHKEEAFVYSVPGSQEIKIEKKGHSHFLQNSTRYQPKQSYDYEEATNHPQPQQVLQRWKGPADTPRPALLEAPRKGKQLKISEFRSVAKWGQDEVRYGQVVAVALDSHGDVVVFHRGERSWDGSTFTAGNVLQDKKNPIVRPALLHLKKDTGEILHKWGEKFFFMPHGLTLDNNHNIWLTDVGLHQLFKFPPGYGDGTPLLSLGTRFKPGRDNKHFCKPTGVAVMGSGEFFVSDGYSELFEPKGQLSRPRHLQHPTRPHTGRCASPTGRTAVCSVSPPLLGSSHDSSSLMPGVTACSRWPTHPLLAVSSSPSMAPQCSAHKKSWFMKSISRPGSCWAPSVLMARASVTLMTSPCLWTAGRCTSPRSGRTSCGNLKTVLLSRPKQGI